MWCNGVHLCNKLWNNWWIEICMQARYQEFHGKIPFMPNDIYVQYSRYMCVMKRDLTRFLFKYVHVACYLFLAFAFCRFCKVICFFHPSHNGLWPPTLKDFLSQILSITFFPDLNSSERVSISLFSVECQTRELLVPF